MLDTLPLEAGDSKQGQQQTISAPPLDPSPISCLPSSPLGLICDDQETHELSPPEVDTNRVRSLDCQVNSDTTLFPFQRLSTNRCNLMLYNEIHENPPPKKLTFVLG